MPSGLFLKAGCFEETEAVKGHSQQKTQARSLLYPLEGRSGFTFVLWSAQPRDGWNEVLTNVLTDHVSRLAASFGSEANPQHRFEQFLGALNEQLATHVREGSWRVPIQQFHALVGIACDDHMFLSGNGDLTALFLHRKPGGRYQVFNLFRSIQTGQALPSWEKPFAVVLDGDLHVGDVLCLSNKELTRVVPPDDLHSSLATLPPTGAAERIRQWFSPHTDLAILILQAQELERNGATAARPLSNVSIEHLGATEDRTTELLEDQRPAVFRAVQRWWRGIMARPRPNAMRHASWMRAMMTGLVAAGRFVGHSAQTTRRVAASRETRRAILQGVKHGFNRLPPRRKYLGLAAVTTFFLFAIGLMVLNRSQAGRAAERAYTITVERAEEKRDAAAAAVIYKDEARAKNLYAEARIATAELVSDTHEREENRTRILNEIDSALNQLRHITTIPDPPLVATLPLTVAGGALARVDGSMYLFASDRGVYRLDTVQKRLQKLPTADSGVGQALAADTDGTHVLYLDDRPGISEFEATDTLLKVTDLAPAAGTLWLDLVTYANRVYVLEKPPESESRVTRFSPTASGWSSPASWIKSKTTPLSDAVGLAIDATIFVLKKNGTLVRFSGGNELSWSQETVDPPVQEATDVWTDAESSFVYLLEPAARRLLVYKKDNGALAAQYLFPSLDDLKDLAVDEKNATVYLLSGPTLYAIRVNHL